MISSSVSLGPRSARLKDILNPGVVLWRPVAKVIIEIGFTVPTDYRELEAFWLVGRLTLRQESTVTPAQSGVMFIAWRCLYAEMIHSRVDKVPISMQKALNNTMRMTITRLRTYTEKGGTCGAGSKPVTTTQKTRVSSLRTSERQEGRTT